MVNVSGFSIYKIGLICKEIVLCLPFPVWMSGISAQFPWIRASIQHWIEMVRTNFLHFFDLGEEAIQFSTINSGVSYGFSVDASLSYWESFPFLVCWVLLLQKSSEFCEVLSLHVLKMILWFFGPLFYWHVLH